MKRIDPRTKLALGLMAIGAVFIAHRPETLVVECILIFVGLTAMGMLETWLRSIGLILPMVVLVLVIAILSFDLRVALLLSTRLVNLLTVSFIFFRKIDAEEMGDGLRKMGIPYMFTFILTTSMRYVPLIGQKIRNIYEAQLSRGIDLRPRLKNALNFMALLMPLLVQSFVLSEELALAMESRGFGRQGRSFRRQYRLGGWEYGLMLAAMICLVAFFWWERG